MKKIFLLYAILFFGLLTRVSAQYIPSYTFSQSTFSPYAAITGGNVLASGTGYSNEVFSVSLPFTFNFDNVGYNSIKIAINGFISFGSTDPGIDYWMIASSNSGFRVVSGFDANLASLNASTELSHKTIGTTPNRIFVSQWTNFGRPSTTALSANFQIKLYETTNVVEISYGNCSLSGASSLDVQVGLRGLNNSSFNSRYSSSGSWTSSVQSSTNTQSIEYNGGVNPPSTLSFTYTPPPVCTTPNVPSNLLLSSTTNSISGNFSASVPAASGYLVVRTPNVPLSTSPVDGVTYTVSSSLGNGTVDYDGALTSYTSGGLSMNTVYTYTIFPYNQSGCMGGPKYNSSSSLFGSLQTLGPKKYTWVPISGNADFQLASNWSPARNLILSGDTLFFSNGGSSVATNVPTQSATILQVNGNTMIALLSATTSTITLSDKLSIENGSVLSLGGNSTVNLKFTTSTLKTAIIDGTLNIDSSSNYNGTNANTIINGSMYLNGSLATITNTAVSAPANFTFINNGNYYHARNGGALPNAYFGISSNVYITGCVNTVPTIAANQSFGNFIWDCAAQTATISLGSKIDSTYGNCIINNTNNQVLNLGTIASLNVLGNFIQNASIFKITTGSSGMKVFGNMYLNSGTLDLSGSTTSTNTLTLSGNVFQLAPHTITRTGTGIPGILLNGSTHQQISIGGTSANVPVNYTLNNITGATLTGILTVGSGATHSIIAGSWDGTGMFSYDPLNSKLEYVNYYPVTTSPVEWPSVNSPYNIFINALNAVPNNRILLPGNRTINGSLTLYAGVLVLGPYSLTMDGAANALGIPTPTASNMIAADSTGQLIRKISPYAGTSSVQYTFPVGDTKGVHEGSGFNINVTSNAVTRYISVRVRDDKHPNELSSTDYVTRYWTVTDNLPASPFSYLMVFSYPPAENIGTPNFCIQRYSAGSWTGFPSLSLATFNNYALKTSDTISTLVYPLTGDFTGRVCTSNIYSWTGVIDMNYQLPGNWTPSRNNPTPADVLQFNAGNTDTVKNIPSESIGRLIVSNNTTVSLQGALVSVYNHYIIHGDYDTSTNELFIANGSALYINGISNGLNLEFSSPGTYANGKVDGLLEIQSTNATQNSISFANSYIRITPTGRLAVGTSNGSSQTMLNPGTLVIEGTYEHKYTTVAGVIPVCNWKPGSTLLIDGFTSSTLYLDFGDTVYNVIYDCPNQTGNVILGNYMPLIVATLNVISTGTGQWIWFGTTNGLTFNVAQCQQSGGTINIASTSAGSLQTFNLTGNFLQTGGQMISTGTGSPVFHCNGISGTQTVQFYNSAPTGPITFRISNQNGIQLNGAGSLTSTFNINSGGGLQVSTPNSNPINTALTLVYSNTNTTLTYDGLFNSTTNSLLFPVTGGPTNLTTKIGNGHTLSLPFDRVIPGTLTMSNGDIDISSHSLIVGNSTTNPGLLNWTSGSIMMTTGSLTRWYATSGLPTTAGTGIGFYPVSTQDHFNRNVSIYFNSSGSLSNGGTLTLTHNNISGFVNGLNVTDGSATLISRSNASWQMASGNGISMSTGTCGMRLTAGSLVATPLLSNLHLMQTNSVSGVHVPASGISPDYKVERIGMSLTDLTTNHYIGSETNLSSNIFISIATGNWSNGSTWNQGTSPGTGDIVIISAGTQVEIDGNQSAKIISIISGGILSNTSGILILDSALVNNGSLLNNLGSITMGPAGGGKAPLINYGNFNVSGGSIYINGNLSIEAGSNMTQSGGNISIDGNASGIAANSVPATTPLLNLFSPSLFFTGGVLTIVDPHVASSGDALKVNPFLGIVTFSTNHTFQVGDGILTTASTTNSSFRLDCGYLNNRINFGQVLIKIVSSSLISARISNGIVLLGDLILENNSILHGGSSSMVTKGNIVVNAGTKLYLDGGIVFADRTSTTDLPATVMQTVSGSGIITSSSYPYSSFYGMRVNNSSAGGVRLLVPNCSFSSLLQFIDGVLDLDTNTLTENHDGQTFASQSTGWVVGKFRNYFQVGSPFGATFPVGDMNSYTPVSITGSTTAIQTSGFIEVEVLNNDHPSIFSSAILPNKSVNKHVKIKLLNTINLVTPYVAVTFNWQPANTDAGVNPYNFIASRYSSGSWDTAGASYPNPLSLIYSNLGNDVEGEYQVGERNPIPWIVSQPVSQTLCEGSNTSFSIITSLPSVYQWQYRIGSAWFNLSNGPVYSNVSGAIVALINIPLSLNGTEYRCRIINGTDTAYSSTVQLSVNPALLPGISIAASPSNIICVGSSVTFTATPVNGGNAPQYQWNVNGINTGVSSSSFTSSTFNNNDIVTCVMTNNAVCATSLTDISNAVTMGVNAILTPSVSITANPGFAICAGTPVTFTATPVNGGSNPSYQWKKNGSNVGINSSTYTDNALITGNSITCVITSNETCLSGSNATSNAITMSVTNLATPVVTIAANPGLTICNGVNVTFTATPVSGGTTPQYQWLKNGSAVGTNSITYNDNGLLNTDQISCVLTSSIQCVSSMTDTSNILAMTVNPSLTPSATISVAPSDTICVGTSASFSAVIINQGVSITYSWKKNGTTVSSGLTYSSSGLVNGDIIKLVINTSPQCATTTIDTSNEINMTVLSNVIPTVNITASPGNTICAGNSVTYTAIPAFGGTAPSFQWKKNGLNVGTNSATYTDNGILNADQIQCEMTSNQGCASVLVVNSNTITMTVNPIVIPTISISVLPGITICSGSSVTFTATTTNAGISPSYQWKVNSVNSGTNSNTFTTSTLTNGAIVLCELTSSNVCANPSLANSNSITMIVNPVTTPSVTISASPGVIISTGQLVTFTAVALNAGVTPVYQWKLNTSNVGINSTIYSSSSLVNSDEVTCEVSSSDLCSLPAIVLSNLLKISIADAISETANIFSDIYYYPNPTNGILIISGHLKDNEKSDLTYEILSVTGQTLSSGNIAVQNSTFEKQVQIDETISSGLYLLRLSCNNESALYRIVLAR